MIGRGPAVLVGMLMGVLMGAAVLAGCGTTGQPITASAPTAGRSSPPSPGSTLGSPVAPIETADHRSGSPSPAAPASTSVPSLAATSPIGAVSTNPDAKSTSTPSVAASTSVTAPEFQSSISVIDDALAARMKTSWRSGCPVPLADLRYLTLSYRDFDGEVRSGELVVAADVADDVVAVFHRLYDNRFPIASMRLVDDFGGSDDDSMAADNTSAFNCRRLTGGSAFSEHSYGTAIDINPVQNPYLRSGSVLPPAGAAFASRPDTAGVIHGGDEVVAAFTAIGWSWGGYWSRPTDYQHFSLSGR